MDRIFPVNRAVAAAALLLAMAVPALFAQSGQRSVPGELLVKFADGAESRRSDAANRKVGSIAAETLKDDRWQRVIIPAGKTIEAAMAEYRKLDGVVAVQPNFYYHLLATPNDPMFTSSGMYGLTKISAPQAWDLSTGSSSVVVANIDTGIRYTHQDLAQNAWVNSGETPGNGVDDDNNGFVDDVYGWDFFYNDNNPIDDAGGHGTHTAGTIGAVGNNGLGVVGVNWNVKIMAIKIYSPLGTDSTSAMLVNAYAYIRMMKLRGVNIRVTNNSYGGCGEACGYDQATKDGIDAMGDAGILNVFAAGNDSRNIEQLPSFPASYDSPSVLAVASSNSTDARSSFSNYGPISVDLAAPGSGILSTWATSNTATNTISGTSMATPHVTGAAALLAAFNPTLTPASIKATLMNSVDVLPAWSGVVKTGGRLNVFKALQTPTVCSFPSTFSAPTKGGTFSIAFNPGQNCDYQVRSNEKWINVMSEDTMSGPGTLTFAVTVNPTIRRSGVIRIGGQDMVITQNRSRGDQRSGN